MAATPVKLERSQMQGIILAGYGHLPCAVYLLFRIRDKVAARAWLGGLVGEITTSERKKEGWAMNLALTYEGLQALGVNALDLQSFAPAFQDGMASERRTQILGDHGDSEPGKWQWGSAGNAVHVLVMVFGAGEPALEQEKDRWKNSATAGGLTLVTELNAGRQPNSHEHFGFADGIGQPVIMGGGRLAGQQRRTQHATELQPGEFILGYPNAYVAQNVVSASPTVAAVRDPGSLLPPAAPQALASGTGAPELLHDLGRNGSYLVFRQMSQDVAAFWNFLDQAARAPSGASDPAKRTRLGAKLVGRWPGGAPLVASPDRDDPELATFNNFGYGYPGRAEASGNDHDPHGFRCPVGSHIRRSNPRDSLAADRDAALTSANRHRLLRRGRSYGDRIKDVMVDDGAERGLHFICLNADLERQFEFVQQTWINNPVFGGLHGEVDPLVGDQECDFSGCMFTVPEDPVRTRVLGLRRFTTVKGGAYFFLPGISAVRYLGSLRD